MGEQIAGAVVPSLISGIMGSDEPSYQQPSMDQIMTPLQKELSPILFDQAKRADQYSKLFEGQLPKNQAYFNQQKSNYLSGNPTTMIEAYKRQKQAADDAALLAKGVK